MHIHARGLLYFDAIRRNGSIRGAARQLFVDASAVNRQLIQLEQEVGFPLFERLSSGLRLTPAGELFARHTTNVLQDADWLANELDMLRGIQRGAVSVVGVEGLHATLLPRIFGSMLQRYPGIRLNAASAGSGHIAEHVASGRADVGLAFGLSPGEGVTCAGQHRFALGAIMAPEHPLAGCAQLTVARCAEWPLILGTGDLAAYTLLEDDLRQLAAPPQVAVRSDAIGLMRQLAAAGHGIAFQTRLGLESPQAQSPPVVFVPLVNHIGEGMSGELCICVRSGRTLPPAVAALVDCASEDLARRARSENTPG